MTENELARALFGRKRREAEEAGSATVVVSATAVESSSGGTVVVDFGADVFGDTQSVDEQTGQVVYEPPSQGVEVPAAGGISAGDTVSVLVVDNQPVQAIGTGSVDRVGAVAERAKTTADEAAAVAAAVGQHFWHDTRGAHVTEEERTDYETQASGFQQLMTSIGTLLTRAVNGVEYLLRSDTQSGMAIYDGTCTADDANLPQHLVASFTAQGAQIGKIGESHAEIDSTSLQMVNRAGDVYMHVEDLNGDAGNPIITDDTFLGDGAQTAFELSYAPSTIYEVHRDGSTITSGYSISGRTITFSTAPRYTAYVQYQTQEVVPCFTYGSRANGSTKGLSSVVEGIVNEASGKGAHAEGMYTVASDTAAHAEGAYNTADGMSAHAEGQGTQAHGEGSHAEGQRSYAESFCSHAEGISTHTYGNASHAEGISTEASGEATHAEGYDTIARNVGGLSYQHVQGRWNIEDTQGKYAHIVGNGLSSGTPSNAHTVDWNGNGWFQGDVKCGGTSGDAPAHTLSGAAAAAAQASTDASSALSTANTVAGDAYRKSGNNVVVGGQTIGTADNLSYVSSTNSIRTPVLVTGYSGGTGVNVHANSKVRRSGRQVNAHLIFNVASNSGTSAGAIFVSGLPRPYETNWCTAALTNGSKACRMYVNSSGNLCLDMARPDVGWWTCAVSYFTQD